MKTILKIRTLICVVLAVGALLSTPGAGASDSDSYPSYLEAKVIAHLPLSGGIRRMFLQQEGRRQFLYVQQPSQQGVTVIDITKPERPKVVNQVPLENLTMVSFGLAIFETPENTATVGASLADRGRFPRNWKRGRPSRKRCSRVGSRARRKRSRASADRPELWRGH